VFIKEVGVAAAAAVVAGEQRAGSVTPAFASRVLIRTGRGELDRKRGVRVTSSSGQEKGKQPGEPAIRFLP